VWISAQPVSRFAPPRGLGDRACASSACVSGITASESGKVTRPQAESQPTRPWRRGESHMLPNATASQQLQRSVSEL
jgi:hypothetical protein